MIVHDEFYYESRRPVAKRGTLHNIRKTIWDGEKRTVFHRTSKEWGSKLNYY